MVDLTVYQGMLAHGTANALEIGIATATRRVRRNWTDRFTQRDSTIRRRESNPYADLCVRLKVVGDMKIETV